MSLERTTTSSTEKKSASSGSSDSTRKRRAKKKRTRHTDQQSDAAAEESQSDDPIEESQADEEARFSGARQYVGDQETPHDSTQTVAEDDLSPPETLEEANDEIPDIEEPEGVDDESLQDVAEAAAASATQDPLEAALDPDSPLRRLIIRSQNAHRNGWDLSEEDIRSIVDSVRRSLTQGGNTGQARRLFQKAAMADRGSMLDRLASQLADRFSQIIPHDERVRIARDLANTLGRCNDVSWAEIAGLFT